MSTSGPTASRNVPISVSMCRSKGVVAYWSVVPAPVAKPPPNTDAGSPGWTMLVFRAVYPRSTTSLPRLVMSSQDRMGGTPINSWLRAREVPQWDQYTRTLSRVGPPNSSPTEIPRALALMSMRAQSRPAMALAAIPPGLWRVARNISQKRISKARGSVPIRYGFRSSMVPTTP